MLDNKSVEELITNQISKAVDEQVQTLVAREDWLTKMEDKIQQHIQDRITGKFANISSVPDLITAVQTSVVNLFNMGQIPGLEKYVDENMVRRAVDQSVQNLINHSIDALLLDQQWVDKINALAAQEMTQRFLDRLSLIDVNSVIGDKVRESLPVWHDMLMKDFQTPGISDQSTTRQISITDEHVSVQGSLVCNTATVANGARVRGTLQADNLAITGSINVDNASWNELRDKISQDTLARIDQDWRERMIHDTVALACTQGIEFEDVRIQGESLIQDNTLNRHVTDSNIQKLGTLRELTVKGPANINDSLVVVNQRVGVNTESPESALAVWDEEISLLLGKGSKQQAYIGTGRKQKLTLGVNRTPYLEIDDEGLTTVKQFRVDRWRLGHTGNVPGWSGTRGDIMFNNDPKPNTPFAWVCLGAFRWQEIKLS